VHAQSVPRENGRSVNYHTSDCRLFNRSLTIERSYSAYQPLQLVEIFLSTLADAVAHAGPEDHDCWSHGVILVHPGPVCEEWLPLPFRWPHGWQVGHRPSRYINPGRRWRTLSLSVRLSQRQHFIMKHIGDWSASGKEYGV
jgi:hypothetical protein